MENLPELGVFKQLYSLLGRGFVRKCVGGRIE